LKNWDASGIICPDDVADLVAKVRTSNETGQATEVELRLRRADGIYHWCLLRRLPQCDSHGHIVRSYSLLTDIEDRKQAEDQTRQSETELRQILDFAPQNVVVLALIAIALVCMPIKRRSIILGSLLRSGGTPIFTSTFIQVIWNA
jgi:PAS domain-containing protein